MKRLTSEAEVHMLPESNQKQEMLESLDTIREHYDGPLDVLKELGEYYLIEEGDDLTKIEVNDAVTVDITNLKDMCYENITLSEHTATLLWITNDAGGPCFFMPIEMYNQSFTTATPKGRTP